MRIVGDDTSFPMVSVHSVSDETGIMIIVSVREATNGLPRISVISSLKAADKVEPKDIYGLCLARGPSGCHSHRDRLGASAIPKKANTYEYEREKMGKGLGMSRYLL